MLFRSNEKRKGVIAILVAISMVVLLGICAIVLDGGMMMHNKRKIQAVADAAALAAAEDLYYNYATNKGLDSGSATNTANTVAADNGFITGVVVNIPPKTANTTYFNNKPGFVEVVITYEQPRYFSTIWGTQKLPVVARAIARGTWTGSGAAIHVLDATGSSALSSDDDGQTTVNGAPINVNSNSTSAAFAKGNGKITASQINFGGDSASGNGLFVGPITTAVSPTPDPLAYLPDPDSSGMPLQSAVNAQHGSTTISPGLYKGGISVSNGASLTMLPGIYYISGGGFNFSGNGSLTANGVLICNEPSISLDDINIAGSGQITMSPMTTGIYQGITLWQDRTSTNPINVTGEGETNITGTIYAACAKLNVTCNGSDDTLGSQHICCDLHVSGNGSCKVNYTQNSVGNARVIELVE